MTSEMLKDRIAKVEDRIVKKEKTIESKGKLLTKKQQAIIKAGYDPEAEEMPRDNMEVFWLFCDVASLKDDLQRLPKEIEELKNTLQKYENQLSTSIDRESTYTDEVPECLKQMEQELIDEWDQFDINRKNQLLEDRKTLNHADFSRKYNQYERQQLAYKSDEEIKKENEKEARQQVINLYNRIKNITGEVTDWSGISLKAGARGTAALNGVVTGVQGKARVESIVAGGPVQRLHIRVLVNEIN